MECTLVIESLPNGEAIAANIIPASISAEVIVLISLS